MPVSLWLNMLGKWKLPLLTWWISMLLDWEWQPAILKTEWTPHGGPLHQCTRFSYPDVGFNQRVSRLVSLVFSKRITFNKITRITATNCFHATSQLTALKPDLLMMPVIGLVASAIREDMRLISVVMGQKAPTPEPNENQSLLNYGFRFFESHRLYEGKKPLNEARIGKDK